MGRVRQRKGTTVKHWKQSAWWYWTPLVLQAGLIFYLSSLSHPEQYLPWFFPHLSDKVLHAVAYGILSVLFYRALRHATGPVLSTYAFLAAIAGAALYGLTDEIHQIFVPLRHADVWDLAADAVGASVAAAGWRWISEPESPAEA